ncbi:hypothetical protein WMF18_30160 [Sorangium sp. So ce315]|uniref:hypothetical protein n=1 Tax=Sorangium sp. So ce315 TaxID=3133299 RepID=UPI003F5DB2F6
MAKMLVLGDSILWGQGLNEEDKASNLFRRRWEASLNEAVEVHRFAHSGADIWDDGQSSVIAAIDPTPPPFTKTFDVGDRAIGMTRPCGKTQASRDAIGEVPDEEPYLLRQILDATEELRGTRIDLVLVDAGINDTEVYNLVLPGKSAESVVARGSSVQPRLEFALRNIGASFPDAKVIVTGYYSVVSEQTRARELVQFVRRVAWAAIESGARAGQALHAFAQDAAFLTLGDDPETQLKGLDLRDPLAFPVRNLAARCRDWTTAMHQAIRDAVRRFNDGRNVAAFADPEFGPEHAVFTDQTLLWQFRHGEPQDPKAMMRASYCEQVGIHGFDRLVIECASMGHPNPEGARRYGDAIARAAQELGLLPP